MLFKAKEPVCTFGTGRLAMALYGYPWDAQRWMNDIAADLAFNQPLFYNSICSELRLCPACQRDPYLNLPNHASAHPSQELIFYSNLNINAPLLRPYYIILARFIHSSSCRYSDVVYTLSPPIPQASSHQCSLPAPDV